MSYDKKKMNFVENSISKHFTVFARFSGSFLAVTFWILNVFLWDIAKYHIRCYPCRTRATTCLNLKMKIYQNEIAYEISQKTLALRFDQFKPEKENTWSRIFEGAKLRAFGRKLSLDFGLKKMCFRSVLRERNT